MYSERKKIYGDVVLITGASSGIGMFIAEALANKGFKVYGTSRHVLEGSYENDDKQFPGGGFIKMLQLDVTSLLSVERAVNSVIKTEGRIGILINNAGFGIAGPIEETSSEEAFSQMDTNFFGVYRMCHQVIQHMRRSGKGLIINIGSVAGFISIPFQAFYCASKYGVEALTEALRHEVRPFGIQVTLIEPGDTKTGFTKKREMVKAASEGTVYFDRFQKSVKRMEHDEMSGPEPKAAANAALRLVFDPKPPIRSVIGFEYKAIAVLKKLLPARLFEFAISKMYA